MSNPKQFYSYRFGYKLYTYILSGICTALTVAWISASQRADNNKTYEILWRANYIESRALLGLSLRQTDLIIDQITAQELAMWDLYCSRKDLFRENIARKAMETETKMSK
jgi:hypothetical protein